MNLPESDQPASTTNARVWRELLVFGAVTFSITWGVLALYLVDVAWATQTFGPMKLGAPMFYLAVSAPAIAAIVLTLNESGWSGLWGFIASLARGSTAWPWIAISIFGYPLLWLFVALVTAVSQGKLDSLDLTPWSVTLPAILIGGHLLKDVGALGEEPGWRGYALPRLLRLMSARAAAMLLGFVWAVWHLPAFFLGSLSQSGIDFVPYLLNVMAFSILMTLIYVRSNGNVLWAGIVPHMMFNAVPKAGIAPILWVTVAVGIAVLLICGPHMRRDVGKRSDEDVSK
jgi:membrane protease YdiL (CAAX protease family)